MKNFCPGAPAEIISAPCSRYVVSFDFIPVVGGDVAITQVTNNLDENG